MLTNCNQRDVSTTATGLRVTVKLATPGSKKAPSGAPTPVQWCILRKGQKVRRIEESRMTAETAAPGVQGVQSAQNDIMVVEGNPGDAGDSSQHSKTSSGSGSNSYRSSGSSTTSTSSPTSTLFAYHSEYAKMEAWLDEHIDFANDYFLRKVTRHTVDSWLVMHSTLPAPTPAMQQLTEEGAGSGTATPVRKISAHEFEAHGLLKPIVNTIDGTPTFLSVSPADAPQSSETSQPASGVSTGPRRPSITELRQMDEKDLIFELVKDICNELDVRKLCHRIMQNVITLLRADKGSLFLVQGENPSPERRQSSGSVNSSCDITKAQSVQVDLEKYRAVPIRGKCLVSKLFDVGPYSTLEEMENQEEITIPWGTGIVGYVGESGVPVNIPDAYMDTRFNRNIDALTGYKTRALLCMPIKEYNGDVVGVAEVINKLSGEKFTQQDEKIFASYLQFCGIVLRNAQLYERSQLEVKRNQVLLDLARMIFQEQSTIEHMVRRIMSHTQSLIRCQRVQVLLLHSTSKSTFSRIYDTEEQDNANEDGGTRTSPPEDRYPINIGITGYVARTGKTANIPNAYEDDRFDITVDIGTGFQHKTILCMPIKNSSGHILGVIQLVNKFDNLPFTRNDENFVEAFAIFCGMGIHNTHMYETAMVAMAKHHVTLDVLSYHASASLEDAQKLKALKVPSAVTIHLQDLKFDDMKLEDDQTLTACLRMFLDFGLLERFQIDYEVLCRWLLTVKKSYRNVTYHNWRHAFNVAQMMFAILTATQWWDNFGDIDCLALIIACLCHDLDHRGTNNTFEQNADSSLARLYSTSTLEHHHLDQCLMILNSEGNQILANVSSEKYTRITKVLERSILATDLALYFGKRDSFFKLVRDDTYDWSCIEHVELLKTMLMTVCDLGAITKPWGIQKRVADLVTREFFEQGDKEKTLNITPLDIMDREKESEMPRMQVDFIDSVCYPVFEAFASLSDDLVPLRNGVLENKRRWLEISKDSRGSSDQDAAHESQPEKTK